MAITFARVGNRVDLRETVTDVTCDGSYPANGYPITAAQLGLIAAPDAVEAEMKTAQGVYPVWDTANSKLKMFKGQAGLLLEVSAGDLSTANIVRVTAKGNPIL